MTVPQTPWECPLTGMASFSTVLKTPSAQMHWTVKQQIHAIATQHDHQRRKEQEDVQKQGQTWKEPTHWTMSVVLPSGINILFEVFSC